MVVWLFGNPDVWHVPCGCKVCFPSIGEGSFAVLKTQAGRNQTMANKVTILIADRNPNVREFLKREMEAENHRVILADDAKTLLKAAFEFHPVDILVIDPDLPDMEPSDIITKLKCRTPPLPVVIHALPEGEIDCRGFSSSIFIEKGSRSIEVIKRIIRDIITERAL
jgi:CheY-like chemotaxis protein